MASFNFSKPSIISSNTQIDKKQYRILYCQNRGQNTEDIQTILRNSRLNHAFTSVSNESEFRSQLQHSRPDVILSDYNLWNFSGFEAFQIARQAIPSVPFIFISETMNETNALKAVQAGADDFIFREHLSRLTPAIMAAVKRFELELDRNSQKEFLELVLNSLAYPFFVINVDDHKIVFSNRVKNTPEMDPFPTCYAVSHHRDSPCTGSDHPCPMVQVVATGQPVIVEHNHYDHNNHLRQMEVHCFPIISEDGSVKQIIESSVDITERVQAQEELKKAKERFQALVDTATDAIISRDAQGQISVWNKAAEKMFGYTAQEVMGKELHNIIAPERYRDQAFAKLKTFVKTGKGAIIGQTLEIFAQRRDGSEFPVEVSVSSFQQDGHWQATAIIRDISERKAAEARIHMLSTAVNQSSSGIVLIDKDWKIIYVNPRFTKITGFAESDVYRKPLRILVNRENVSHNVCEELKGTVMSGRVWRSDIHNRRKDGSEYWESVAISSIFDPEGHILQYLLTVDDITSQVEAQKSLEENERKFRKVVEQSNDGIYVLHKKRFQFVNSRFTEITGYSAQDVCQESFDYKTMMTEEGKEVLYQRISALKQGETIPDQYTFQGLTKSGQIRYFEVSIAPIEWEGNPSTLGVLRDVTEAISMQKKLKQALKEARQGEEIKRLFLANMSHEIRTPLNGIIGFLDLLQHSLKDRLNDEEQAYISQALVSGDRLIHTVHEILDMSLIESGTFMIKPKILNLVDLLERVYQFYQPKAQKHNLDFSFDCTEKEIWIHADSFCIQRSLENLIENAIKFTSKGSVTVRLIRQGSEAQIIIQDTGIGITKEYLKHLYQPFSQESEGYTKEFQGVGLGLALTKQYLDLNSIPIDVDSTKGKGTTFTLHVPILKENCPNE